MTTFYEDMFKGNSIKELIKALLEKSGYTVIPYGYESTLSDIKKKLNQRDSKNSRTARRIRSSPDLLVYDDQRNDVTLVEIKMRNAPSETKVLSLKISFCKEFWNDSYLIVVVPCGNIFYAQKVSEIENKQEYNLTKEFERLEEIFTRIKLEDMPYYKTEALRIMGK